MEKRLVDEETYKEIKRYNREEMEVALMSIYSAGFKAGSEAGNKADIKIELVQFIGGLEVKGIGEKTKEKIIQAYMERGKVNE